MDWSELLELAARRLDEMGVPYFVTGSGATITYGEPRFTNDLDIVADFQRGDAERLVAAFPSPEFYLSRTAAEDAIRDRRMFNVIHPTSGLKIDFIVAKTSEFDRLRLTRRIYRTRPSGQVVWYSAPEDVILKKMQFYREGGSEKHLRDIAGVLQTCDQPIDRDYIENWSVKLGVLDVWQLILQRLREAGQDPAAK